LFGITPQRSTTDADMAVKGFVEVGLTAGEIIVLSLVVKGAFEAAWWTSILNGLKAYNRPKNLYNLSKSYFSQGPHFFHLTKSVCREFPKGTPQDSCCGPGYWNILYNSFLNIHFTENLRL